MNPNVLPLHRAKHTPFLPQGIYDAPCFDLRIPSKPALPVAPAAKRQTKKSNATVPVDTRRRGRPPIVHTNALKPYLQAYSSPGHALAKLPRLGDIVTGAVSLNYGENAKPLGIKTAIVLLRRLNTISSEAILDYMRMALRPCSQRHAQRLAMCIRIIERAARAENSKWPEPSHGDGADSYMTLRTIVPCSELGCSVCQPSADAEQAWRLTAADDEGQRSSFEHKKVDQCDEDGWADLEDELFTSD
jgi:hypothetical protein